MYDSNLVSKPSILVINKMDTENSQEKLTQFMEQFENYDSKLLFYLIKVILIKSITNQSKFSIVPGG